MNRLEYFSKLSEAGHCRQTVQNYVKSVRRFLKFHVGSTSLCFEVCKNYVLFLSNLRASASASASEQWFDLYFTEVHPVMLGKKRKLMEDETDESEERFFISSTGSSIYNASNDLERLHRNSGDETGARTGSGCSQLDE
ncbi:hypothetical protein AOLI_G00300050 [Acnodon oligacanthus]